ncbi:hypothetical protein C7C46_01995 [Streptomyces tateyamensis]|uniref:Uncharacterized protein n=1 Tax=Streptomyces tateyamensis TaxID=565073 RepID=A0A2V4PSH3_9ACTN|nr:hypothetical protein C7C46_01995 [Streptomyces tateyamensis]
MLETPLTELEPTSLPSVPPGLPWAPGWCWSCDTERDVIPIGSGTLDGIDVELSTCRWCLALLRNRLTEAGRRNAARTRAGQRAHQLARWSRSLRRRRFATTGRHRALSAK